MFLLLTKEEEDKQALWGGLQGGSYRRELVLGDLEERAQSPSQPSGP